VQEGLFLYDRGLDPYDGGIFHQVSQGSYNGKENQTLTVSLSGATVLAAFLAASLTIIRPWTTGEHPHLCRSGYAQCQLYLRHCEYGRRQCDVFLHVSSRISSLEPSFGRRGLPFQSIYDPRVLGSTNHKLRYVLHLSEREACVSGQVCHSCICSGYRKLHKLAPNPAPSFYRTAMLRSRVLPTTAIRRNAKYE
jgi:hypothetical protein